MRQEPVDIQTEIAALNLLDMQGIEWERVQRTAYLIHQHFRYDHPGPVRMSATALKGALEEVH
ncbi:MAG TPA: hypothetical protein VIY29_29510 [Ktedonobacteraceae bacterium]